MEVVVLGPNSDGSDAYLYADGELIGTVEDFKESLKKDISIAGTCSRAKNFWWLYTKALVRVKVTAIYLRLWWILRRGRKKAPPKGRP